MEIQTGDLVLRDRGYLTSNEIKRHVDSGSDCIYRHKHKTIYLDPVTDKKIDLANLLRLHKKLDIEVYLNDKHRTKIRLIAEPVSEKIANERRRKAKIEMKKHNPSTEMLFLMSWTIFITTIPKAKADFTKILAYYSLRWNIESIFKTWKSNFHFSKMHNVSEKQLRILLSARFIMIVICTHHLFIHCEYIIHKYYNKNLSMMKFFKYLIKNIEKIIELLSAITNTTLEKNSAYNPIAKYCCYDSRKRQNMKQMIIEAFLS